MQGFRHWRPSGFVIGQHLVPPALVAGLIVKHGDRVGRLAVEYQLIQRVLAGGDAGRTLNCVNTSNKVECVNNKQMDSHRSLQAMIQAFRVTLTGPGDYPQQGIREDASQNEAPDD
jgi:hypothetical protein